MILMRPNPKLARPESVAAATSEEFARMTSGR